MEPISSTGPDVNDLDKIRSVFQSDPRVESLILFGSRAMGTHGPGSDIDLAVKGKELAPDDMWAFRQKLEQLHLPWFFDLVHVDRIQDAEVMAHITRVGKELLGPGTHERKL